MSDRRIAFTGHGIDRADHIRADPARLTKLRSDPASRLLVMDGLAAVTQDDALTYAVLKNDDAECVFLGLRNGAALFAAVPQDGDPRPAYEQRVDRAALARLPADQLALYGGARALVDWHARHRFCARCGAPTVIAKGGWQRDCPSCNAQHFPRTDPVVIMLVQHDDALLLGRGRGWPDRAYSALAGFVEPGESMEDAVAREVLEEVGLRVGQVRYVASQPWPFPSQLMIGCHAMAESRTLTVDEAELEDARWFTRADVLHAMEPDAQGAAFVAPPPIAIARSLLQWWMEERP
ncbi:NAD(+) diphosphatase [Erythrobacter arachoides]|uniref:NAD(+) diphosphatase n=1 Tax=Aurantiacibacter arachoides TaxID=1850444 RepID=A0A845A2R8_9SPHN|nr:NAD(+) diphosphatase [Aurantiacibacter arachoides]MXO93722.1 NAD(+) diphosphatase [Aurantiacibacter arachoides]GGD47143.1 NADH pyrophosphatase [Aurantiacibacter arachoides]